MKRIISVVSCIISIQGLFGCADESHPDVKPIEWNESINYSTLIDKRDAQTYRSVQIGSQKWMAQNLNYAGAGKCYHKENAYCPVYGRLYTWYDLKIDSTNHKGICPDGWHVPSSKEWLQLIRYATSDPVIVGIAKNKIDPTLISRDYNSKDSLGAIILRAADGWNDGITALDYFGFRIIPYNPENKDYRSVSFWTSTNKDNILAEKIWLISEETYIGYSLDVMSSTYSVRCINDTTYSINAK